MRTHEDVAGVQAAIQEGLLGVRDVDATQGCFRERVGGDQGQTIQAHLVDAVNGLKPGANVGQSIHFNTLNTHFSCSKIPNMHCALM